MRFTRSRSCSTWCFACWWNILWFSRSIFTWDTQTAKASASYRTRSAALLMTSACVYDVNTIILLLSWKDVITTSRITMLTAFNDSESHLCNFRASSTSCSMSKSLCCFVKDYSLDASSPSLTFFYFIDTLLSLLLYQVLYHCSKFFWKEHTLIYWDNNVMVTVWGPSHTSVAYDILKCFLICSLSPDKTNSFCSSRVSSWNLSLMLWLQRCKRLDVLAVL